MPTGCAVLRIGVWCSSMSDSTTPPYVLGLDLALAKTGWARLDMEGRWETGTIKTVARVKAEGADPQELAEDLERRWVEVAEQVWPLASTSVLVGYEDLPKRPMGGPSTAATLGQVHAAVRLRWRGVVRARAINVSSVKKLATGKGQATKTAVALEASRRLGYEGASEDEADAMWVAIATALLGGFPVPFNLPKLHLSALDTYKKEASHGRA